MCATKSQHESQKHRPSNQPCGCNISTNGEGGSKNAFSRAYSSADQAPGNDEAKKVAQEIPKSIEYRGVKYRLMRCGKYYMRTTVSKDSGAGRMLHRQIYQDAFGLIPANLDVHHKDGNTLNNTLGNLSLMSRSEHTRHHQKQRAVAPAELRIMQEAIGKARQVNPRHAPPTHSLVCQRCEKVFTAHISTVKFCSSSCRSQVWYASKKGEVKIQREGYRERNRDEINRRKRERYHRDNRAKQIK